MKVYAGSRTLLKASRIKNLVGAHSWYLSRMKMMKERWGFYFCFYKLSWLFLSPLKRKLHGLEWTKIKINHKMAQIWGGWPGEPSHYTTPYQPPPCTLQKKKVSFLVWAPGANGHRAVPQAQDPVGGEAERAGKNTGSRDKQWQSKNRGRPSLRVPSSHLPMPGPRDGSQVWSFAPRDIQGPRDQATNHLPDAAEASTHYQLCSTEIIDHE